MPRLSALLHVSLLVSDLGRARAFYEKLLGLSPLPSRPDLGFPGVWYAVGVGEIHLLCLPSPDPVVGRPEHGGRDRHAAFAVEDWEGLRQTLLRAGVPFTLSRSGRRAIFVRDPDGNALELLSQ